jgi:hypothetical protein
MANNAEKQHSSSSLREFHRKPGALIVTAAIVVLGAFLGLALLLPHGQRIKSDGYQVVYMVSGQAYFGKLQNTGGDYLVLKTPYTAQSVTPASEKAPEGKQASTTLVKVSQQTYGPEDVMSLKSDQVLFWQNLRSDSKVSKAIESKN